MVRSPFDGTIDGRFGLLVDFVDENLNSGRMCYAVVMFDVGKKFYISPAAIEVISDVG